MTIKYGLRPGTTPPQMGKLVPVIPQNAFIPFEILIKDVAQRAATTEGIVANVMAAYRDLVKQHILEGNTIPIGNICRLFPTLTGMVETADVAIRDTDKLMVSMAIVRPLLKEIRQEAQLDKILVSSKRSPYIVSIKDVVTGLSNVFSPGGIVRIIGERLDFDSRSAAEGVFLSYSDPERPVIRVENYGRRGNKLIELVIGRDLFARTGNPAVYPTGLWVTVKSTYSNKGGILRERLYETPLYRAPIFGGVTLLDFVPAGETGLSELKITRDGNGPKVKLSYLAPGASRFGRAQTIAPGRDETYLLKGSDPQTSALTVAVKADDFYTSSEVSQVVSTGKPLEITQDLY